MEHIGTPVLLKKTGLCTVHEHRFSQECVWTDPDPIASHEEFLPMAADYWTIQEVIEIFQLDEMFLSDLEEQEVVCPICAEGTRAKLFSTQDLEKLRLAKMLVEDMEVNLPGVEIILRMRQNMLEMRKQFDSILEELARHLKENLQYHP